MDGRHCDNVGASNGTFNISFLEVFGIDNCGFLIVFISRGGYNCVTIMQGGFPHPLGFFSRPGFLSYPWLVLSGRSCPAFERVNWSPVVQVRLTESYTFADVVGSPVVKNMTNRAGRVYLQKP
jgi:hypothetical protein